MNRTNRVRALIVTPVGSTAGSRLASGVSCGILVVASLGLGGCSRPSAHASAVPSDRPLQLPLPADWSEAGGYGALEVFVFPEEDPASGVKLLWCGEAARATLTAWCDTTGATIDSLTTTVPEGHVRTLAVTAGDGFGRWPAGSELVVAIYASMSGTMAWGDLADMDQRQPAVREVRVRPVVWQGE
jgi:hypothetical protein